jgi:hypothetical protein
MRRLTVLLFAFAAMLCSAQEPSREEGLAGYWPFNGNIQDEGPNRLLTVPHNVSWTKDRFGRPGSALALNGDHAYVEVPDHPALHLYNFTYSLWLRTEDWITNDAFFLAKRLDNPANRFSIAIYPRSSLLNTFICDSVGNENYFHSLSLWVCQPNTWHNLAVVGDHDDMSYLIYIDGELAGQKELNIAAAYDQNPLTFGVWALRDDFGDFFKGQLDDIRIFNRALSPEEVWQLAADRPGGKAIGTAWMNTELPDGRYVVHQMEKQGIISNVPFLFELKSRRPFWQTGYFLGGSLLAACLLALMAQYYRYNEKVHKQRLELVRLQALEQERSRIARDLHDDLGSGLSAIGLLTEIARQKSQDAGMDAEINQMAAASTELSRKIREIIWLVSARFDKLENLAGYLHHFTLELFADAATELEVRLPEEMPIGPIGGEQRRAFFQAVKTALILLHQTTPARLRLEISQHEAFSLSLQYSGPDWVTPESAAGRAFEQALRQLRESGGSFSLEKNGQVMLLFSIQPRQA